MTASAAQLRAVTAALTPELFEHDEPWRVIGAMTFSLTAEQGVTVFQAVNHGNMALWRAVALTLELDALRLEQEARHGFGKSCTSCIWEQGLPPCPGCCSGEIAEVVRAHWAK